MKVFEGSGSSWGSKVNFVDDNDVFVGYDSHQNCCEHADWFIAEEITASTSHSENETGIDLESYVFDKDSFEEVECGDADCSMVAFRLVSEGNPDLYLHLFNVHNGYYSHGFEVKHSGEVVESGSL